MFRCCAMDVYCELFLMWRQQRGKKKTRRLRVSNVLTGLALYLNTIRVGFYLLSLFIANESE